MTMLTLKGIKKRYGNVEILQHIDLDIRSGEFIVFVGPSGCGKSTLLRVIAGLEDITAGTFSIDGEVVNDRTPKERGIAMVFQSYALYPHMTVYQNMAFGLTLDKGTPKSEIDVRVRRAAEALQLTPYLERLPKALSGGQRQRVAIGRAITRDPKVFLFDEPLSNLDAALRVQTRIEIARLHEQMPNTTMIYVTHDQVEAMTLADRIVVLNGGRVEQVGSPLELYDDPDNLFVARFLGSPAMNILPATAREGRLDLHGAQGEQTLSAPPGIQGALHLGVRPEHLHLVPAGQGILSGVVTLTEQLGELTLVYLDLGNGGEPLVAKVAGKAELYPGQQVQLTSAPEHLRYFDAEGRALRQHRHSAVA